MSDVTYAKGLEGVIATESRISKVDGENGKLYYLGYSITDLVEHCDFEEVTYLLLHGELPNREQLDEFRKKMRNARELKEPIVQMVRDFPEKAKAMELLQSSIAYLSGYVEHVIEHSATCNCRRTLHQVVQISGVVAALARLRAGNEYIPPRTDLSHGANFLYQLTGEEPDEFDGKVMDDALILHAEHGLNASTFTARVVASTISTCYASISAAIGALYGSLHGGANEKAMMMVEEIGDPSKASEYVNKVLDERGKIMGMGHRVYKAKDPRAIIMEDYLLELSKRKNDMRYYEILKNVEQAFRDRMEEKGKPIYPNVDFFSGAIYTLLGIPRELFTPIFAMSRVSGWLAHILEQRENNRLFRPRALYVGSEGRPFVPIDQR